MRTRLAILFCLLPLLCFGQTRRMMLAPALASASSGSVSNFWATNYGTPVANWIADNAIYAGASSNVCTNLPDIWVNNYAATNGSQIGKAPVTLTNSLNGHHTLRFDGVDDFLKNSAYTNTQPFELWMVMRYRDSTNSNSHYLFDGVSATLGRVYWLLNGAYAAISAGTSLYDTTFAPYTNNWKVVTMIFANTSSGIFTNNIAEKTGNAGYTNQNGIVFGAAKDFLGCAPVEIAEVAAFGATNTPTDRAAIFSGFTNKYGNANF
jgi:hypothetical protein